MGNNYLLKVRTCYISCLVCPTKIITKGGLHLYVFHFGKMTWKNLILIMCIIYCSNALDSWHFCAMCAAFSLCLRAGSLVAQVFFRGDQPHMTAAERTNKQNQAQALQDALRKQIEEQRAAKVQMLCLHWFV